MYLVGRSRAEYFRVVLNCCSGVVVAALDEAAMDGGAGRGCWSWL